MTGDTSTRVDERGVAESRDTSTWVDERKGARSRDYSAWVDERGVGHVDNTPICKDNLGPDGQPLGKSCKLG